MQSQLLPQMIWTVRWCHHLACSLRPQAQAAAVSRRRRQTSWALLAVASHLRSTLVCSGLLPLVTCPSPPWSSAAGTSAHLAPRMGPRRPCALLSSMGTSTLTCLRLAAWSGEHAQGHGASKSKEVEKQPCFQRELVSHFSNALRLIDNCLR